MTDAARLPDTQDIVFDETFPHVPAVLWRALTDGELIGRWLMQPQGFAAVTGNRFTYQTTPAGAWDGVIRCEVLEVRPNERLVYSWTGGDAGNVGYGSQLDTVVSWTLSPVDAGTRLQLIHAGFVRAVNDMAFENMSDGWTKVLGRLDTLVRSLS